MMRHLVQPSSLAFDCLAREVSSWKQAGQRIVLCHGCFDPLHIGHLRHFKAARKLGDRLVVTVTPDCFVRKGAGRPLFSEALRLEMVQALRVVDGAAVNLWQTAVETIEYLQPDLFVKGSDYQDWLELNPRLLAELEVVRKVGGLLVFTKEFSCSSSALVKEVFKAASLGAEFSGDNHPGTFEYRPDNLRS